MQNVEPEILVKLRDLNQAKIDLALRIQDLELERLQNLVTARKVKAELDGLFDDIGQSRGIPSGEVFQVDMQTGEVIVASEASTDETA